MARIAEKLKSPVVERLDLTRHYITFDCDFACYMVLNPSSSDKLEGSDVVGIPIGSWQVDAWSFLTKDHYPNRAGFSAVFVYDADKVNPPDTETPSVRYSDVDIAHAVSGLRGQPVNITQFTCTEAMPVQITTPDKEPLTVSTSGIMYDPAICFASEKDLLAVSGFARLLDASEKQGLSLQDRENSRVYDIDLARLSLNARWNKVSLRLFPSGVGTLSNFVDSPASDCIPFSPNRLFLEFGYDVAQLGEKKGRVYQYEAVSRGARSSLEEKTAALSDAFAAYSALDSAYTQAVFERDNWQSGDGLPSVIVNDIKHKVFDKFSAGEIGGWTYDPVHNPALNERFAFSVPFDGAAMSEKDSAVWAAFSPLLGGLSLADIKADFDRMADLYKASGELFPKLIFGAIRSYDSYGNLQGGPYLNFLFRSKGTDYLMPLQSRLEIDLASVSFASFSRVMSALGAWTDSAIDFDFWAEDTSSSGSYSPPLADVNEWRGASDVKVSEYLAGKVTALEPEYSDALAAYGEAQTEKEEAETTLQEAESQLEEAREALEEYTSKDDSVILIDTILWYSQPFTAFKKDSSGRSKAVSFPSVSASQRPYFFGSIQ